MKFGGGKFITVTVHSVLQEGIRSVKLINIQK